MTPRAGGSDAERTPTRAPTQDGEFGSQRPGEQAASERSVDGSPARISMALAVGFATLGALTLPSTGFVLSGLLGALVVGAATLRGSEAFVGFGALLLLVGAVFAGALRAPPEPLVLRTLLALLAWDAGRYAIAIGEQLGRSADTRRIELAHSAFAAAVGVAGAGLGYATFRALAGRGRTAAALLLLVGAVVLVLALRDAASPAP